MNRRKSLMIPAILLLCLFLISGCGDGVPEGTLQTTGGTITVESNLEQVTGEDGLLKNQSCIVTAKLMDSGLDPVKRLPRTPQPLSGREVTFSIVSNESGATLYVHKPITDANGNASAIYFAGSSHAGVNVQDVIQARVLDIVGAISMTRLGGAAQKGSGFYLTFTSAPTTPKAGESGMITAYVTDNTTDRVPIKDVIVTFSFLNNNSGATFSVLQAKTDASGTATTVYTAGKPTKSVQDIIQASVTDNGITGSTNYTVITVSP